MLAFDVIVKTDMVYFYLEIAFQMMNNT